ncbi:MAG: MFS transporter [Lactovum sp.]
MNNKENWLKNIIIFLTGQSISLFGSSIVQYAIMWYVTLQTESGMMMTIYILCGFIPTFLLSPFAGVWADRYHRKWLIILSDSFIACATLILALLFLNGNTSIYLLFGMAAIRAVGTGIQTPVVGAVLPQIVPKEKLTRVNGINGSIQAIMMFAAPLVSATLLTVTSLEMILFIDVITALLAVSTLLFFLKIPSHKKALEKQEITYLTDFKEGIAYIKSHDFLKNFFFYFALIMFFTAPASFLTPLQVTRSFGGEVWKLTAIEISFSIGMMIGGAVIASWEGFSNKIKTIVFSSYIMSVCTIGLGIRPLFWIYLLFMAIFGIAMPIFSTPSNVLLQEKVEEAYLGRVFGVMGMISTSMMPLGMLVFGPIADILAIEYLLIGSGLVLVFLTFLVSRNKSLLKAGK